MTYLTPEEIEKIEEVIYTKEAKNELAMLPKKGESFIGFNKKTREFEDNLERKFNPDSNEPIDLTFEERGKLIELLDDFCKQAGILNGKTNTSDDIYLN
jgi:hypothetical protein